MALQRSITVAELEDMMARYRIGKKPLSQLLGWGVTTVLLYAEQEELPCNEYTCKLYELYTHPEIYAELLETHKSRISGVAYNKSLKAVLEMFPDSRLFRAADFLLQTAAGSDEEMSVLRLETILFWSQVVSLVLNGRELFDEDYQPGRQGLPYRAVAERVNTYGCIRPDVIERNSETFSELGLEEIDILTTVYKVFSWYGPAALSAFMDAERYRLCGPPGARRRRVASRDLIRKCYTEVFEQAKVHRLKDVEGYLQKRINYIRKEQNK